MILALARSTRITRSAQSARSTVSAASSRLGDCIETQVTNLLPGLVLMYTVAGALPAA